MTDNLSQCEAVQTDGEIKCDRCQMLWFGELAKTDWRPSDCLERITDAQAKAVALLRRRAGQYSIDPTSIYNGGFIAEELAANARAIEDMQLLEFRDWQTVEIAKVFGNGSTRSHHPEGS